MASARKILMTGMFDMHNFGDLMFPLVARMQLVRFGFEVVPVSATGKTPNLRDALPSVSLARLLETPPDAHGVLIGGGYIIHGHRLDILREYREGDTGAWVGPGMWIGGTLIGALTDVPIAWNAPGAPHPVGGESRDLAAPTYAAADYLSVRDAGSKKLLGAGGEAATIVPDTIVDLPKLWTARSLEGDFKAMRERLGLPPNARILAVHTRGRSLGGETVASFGAKLDQACRTFGLTPVFVGLGSAHNDDVMAAALHEAMSVPSAALTEPVGLREVAALLAHSEAYVGSSLHGYMAAYSYDRPAVLVARPSYQKFSGFIDHIKRPGDLARNWDEALQKLSDLSAPGAPPSAVTENLSRHWATIAATFERGAEPGRVSRLDFLRKYMASGFRKGGTGWSFLPLTNQATLDAAKSGVDVKDKDPI